MRTSKPRLGEYAFRLIAPVVGVIVGLLVVILVLPRFTDHLLHLPGWFIPVVIIVALVVAVGATILGIAIGRVLVKDRIEVALRAPGGKWTHGRLDVASGGFTFERYRFQMRIPSGEITTYQATSIGEDTGRRPPLRKLWSINPQLHIIEVGTNLGAREIAALPSRITELQKRLRGA